MTTQLNGREDAGGSEVVVLQQRVPFTMIDNPIIRESTDYVALGMYVDLMSYPPGRKINLRDIAKVKKQGRTVLTDAMNSLIARRLVFRVRFQETTGQWKTRTYVCARPVTLDELRAVRAEYNGKCSIETTPEFSTALNPMKLYTADGAASSGGGADAAVNPLVTPSARFPALGEPAPGQPAVGAPASGNQAPQREEVKDLDPPPTPTDVAQAEAAPSGVEEEDHLRRPATRAASGGEPDGHEASRSLGVAEHADTAAVVAALSASWPVGQRDLARLRPGVSQALGLVSAKELIEHLVSNTGGAIHPPSVLRARLDNLPEPRMPLRRRAAWCGHCAAETYRWLTDHDGQPVRPCPTCSPQAVRTTTSTTTVGSGV